MASIHMFDGDKGGVGKSYCSNTCIQYFLDKNIPFIPVEADRYNPDVANRYPHLKFQLAVFSDDERQTKADEIRDLAIEKPVIISLPSQVGKPLNSWLETALLDAAEYNVKFVRWFVTSGTFESLNLFQIALSCHGKNFPHVLVKNHGVGSDWSELEEMPELTHLMKECEVKVIDFPKMPWRESNIIQKNNWTFAYARESHELHSMQRTRIKLFLQKAYAAFESTGLIP